MKEIWKTHPVWTRYKVSTLGRVKRKARTTISWRYGNPVYRRWKSKILNQSLHSWGYPQVSLEQNGKRRCAIVGHLVLETFVGPRPKGAVMRHFPDRNPLNCKENNLSWATPSRNQRDRRVHGTINVDHRGTKNPFYGRRHSEATKAKIRESKLRKEIGLP